MRGLAIGPGRLQDMTNDAEVDRVWNLMKKIGFCMQEGDLQATQETRVARPGPLRHEQGSHLDRGRPAEPLLESYSVRGGASRPPRKP
jgi:hypothetical protein